MSNYQICGGLSFYLPFILRFSIATEARLSFNETVVGGSLVLN